VAAMARQYVRGVVASVQRVAMAISPSRLSSNMGPKSLPVSPEALTLARWIYRSYRYPIFIHLNSHFLGVKNSKIENQELNLLSFCSSFFIECTLEENNNF